MEKYQMLDTQECSSETVDQCAECPPKNQRRNIAASLTLPLINKEVVTDVSGDSTQSMIITHSNEYGGLDIDDLMANYSYYANEVFQRGVIESCWPESIDQLTQGQLVAGIENELELEMSPVITALKATGFEHNHGITVDGNALEVECDFEGALIGDLFERLSDLEEEYLLLVLTTAHRVGLIHLPIFEKEFYYDEIDATSIGSIIKSYEEIEGEPPEIDAVHEIIRLSVLFNSRHPISEQFNPSQEGRDRYFKMVTTILRAHKKSSKNKSFWRALIKMTTVIKKFNALDYQPFERIGRDKDYIVPSYFYPVTCSDYEKRWHTETMYTHDHEHAMVYHLKESKKTIAYDLSAPLLFITMLRELIKKTCQ